MRGRKRKKAARRGGGGDHSLWLCVVGIIGGYTQVWTVKSSWSEVMCVEAPPPTRLQDSVTRYDMARATFFSSVACAFVFPYTKHEAFLFYFSSTA